MKAEIISVGTELLLGHTINTDAAHVARALSSLGIDLHHACVVGDNAARLEECLRAALQRSDLVITTGGLGPTNDDLTKETVARVLGLPLEEDADSLRRLREYFGDRPVGENQYKQAWLPRGSHAFANSVGTAPGCAAPAEGGKLVILLPGPPSELLPMLHDEVVPWLARKTGACIHSSMVRTFALGEGDAELRLRDMTGAANPTVATYATDGEMFVRITAKAATAEEAALLVAPVRDAVCRRLGEHVYGVDVENLESVVVPLLLQRGETLTTAESCTGGLLAKRITGPIEDISEAARRLGSGDFTARAPVDGCVELADFATTFNNMAARLQTIDNSRGQFMGNIAHELRTPMTTIKGFIDGMLDGTIPPEETKHYLGIVSQETGRLARLVQNMLDITKLEAGEVPIHAQTYDLWKTVTDVVLSDEQRIEDGKIDIQGLGGDPLLICADPDFVHQVVYNIVDNAIKFTPAGGTISFAAERRGNMVEVRIENTGAGIAPEALPFVFERFYKEDRSRGMNTRGSGLGLHICKILINLSGGQIHAESEEGNWCRFVFTLPAGQ